jgi:hypothetical protein
VVVVEEEGVEVEADEAEAEDEGGVRTDNQRMTVS